jgi:hypothetical protein
MMARKTETPRVIAEVMSSLGLSPKDIPEEEPFNPRKRWSLLKYSLRYYKVKGKGWYGCGCTALQTGDRHNWASPYSWCIIDLKEQKIRYSWYEKCQLCDTKTLPKFPLDEIRIMAEFVVKKHLVSIGEMAPEHLSDSEEEERQEKGPHLENLCAMCRELKRPCWVSTRTRMKSPHQPKDKATSSDGHGYNRLLIPVATL